MQIFIERIQLSFPERALLLYPIIRRTQWSLTQATVVDAALFSPRDETRCLENAKMFRDGRRRDVEWFGQRRHGTLTLRKPCNDRPARGIGQSAKYGVKLMRHQLATSPPQCQALSWQQPRESPPSLVRPHPGRSALPSCAERKRPSRFH